MLSEWGITIYTAHLNCFMNADAIWWSAWAGAGWGGLDPGWAGVGWIRGGLGWAGSGGGWGELDPGRAGAGTISASKTLCKLSSMLA